MAFTETLSARLRALVEREREDIEVLTHRVVQTLLTAVPDYLQSRDPQMMQDLRMSALANAHLWFNVLLNNQSLTPEVLSSTVQFAPRRVHQGVSLPGLLRAYRVIAHSFWTRMLEAAGSDAELHTELLYKVSPYLLQHFDVVAEAIARSYLEEQARHGRWRDRLRQELFTVVTSRCDDAQGFRSCCESLELNPGAAHSALAIRFSREPQSRLENIVDAPIATLARKLDTGAGQIMRMIHRDHLVAWIEVPHGRSSIAFDQQLARVAEGLVDQQNVAAVGIGLPGVGAHGWRISMEQGFRALVSSPGPTAGGGIFRFSQMVLDDAVSVSLNVSSFMSAMIEALALEPALLETLQAYVQHKQHRKATAAALNVHPNTIDHRLERIEALLDGRFDDIDWLARLHTALRLFRPRTG